MLRSVLFIVLMLLLHTAFTQDKKVTILSVPSGNQYSKIDPGGISIMPSGRFVQPAGQIVRITHDPFGMAVSADGKKAVTLY